MQQMGLQARLMSQALRKMSGNASKAGCTLMFLNQIRYKVWYIDTLTSWLFFLPFYSVIWYATDRSLLRESWSHQWRDSFEILCISSPRDTTHWENKIGKIYEVNSLFLHQALPENVYCMSKAKGDEDVGVKVRVRVQKSKVCQRNVKFLLGIMLGTS